MNLNIMRFILLNHNLTHNYLADFSSDSQLQDFQIHANCKGNFVFGIRDFKNQIRRLENNVPSTKKKLAHLGILQKKKVWKNLDVKNV